MQQYKVDKNIPIWDEAPTPNSAKYPFKRMEVGDSFLYGEYSRANMQHIGNAARNWKNKSGREDWKFSCRKTKANKVRIWRVK